MKDLTKKVMILNNFTSPYISEAIIILKDYSPEFETRAIKDAERIVNEYLGKKDGPQKATVRPIVKFLKFMMGAVIMGICFSLGFFLKH